VTCKGASLRESPPILAKSAYIQEVPSMQSSLAFILAAALSGVQPDAPPENIPAPPGYEAPSEFPQPHGPMRWGEFYPFAYPTGHSYPDVTPQGIYGPRRCDGWMYPNGICGHHCVRDPHSWKNFWCEPGNMLPHYHYFAAEHGYFYFEPYNVTRVAIQQSFAASFGGNPRHPYAQDVFDKVEEKYLRRHPEDRAPLDNDLPEAPLTPPDNDDDLTPELPGE
jgi:hypothetical protein